MPGTSAILPPFIDTELREARRSRHILDGRLGQRLTAIRAIRFRDVLSEDADRGSTISPACPIPGASCGWLELAFERSEAVTIVETPGGDALQVEEGDFVSTPSGQALVDSGALASFARVEVASLATAVDAWPARPQYGHDRAAACIGRRLSAIAWLGFPGFSPQAGVELAFGPRVLTCWLGLDCAFGFDIPRQALEALGYASES